MEVHEVHIVHRRRGGLLGNAGSVRSCAFLAAADAESAVAGVLVASRFGVVPAEDRVALRMRADAASAVPAGFLAGSDAVAASHFIASRKVPAPVGREGMFRRTGASTCRPGLFSLIIALSGTRDKAPPTSPHVLRLPHRPATRPSTPGWRFLPDL